MAAARSTRPAASHEPLSRLPQLEGARDKRREETHEHCTNEQQSNFMFIHFCCVDFIFVFFLLVLFYMFEINQVDIKKNCHCY